MRKVEASSVRDDPESGFADRGVVNLCITRDPLAIDSGYRAELPSSRDLRRTTGRALEGHTRLVSAFTRVEFKRAHARMPVQAAGGLIVLLRVPVGCNPILGLAGLVLICRQGTPNPVANDLVQE